MICSSSSSNSIYLYIKINIKFYNVFYCCRTVVVVVRGVAFTWTGVHAQTILQPLVVQSGLTVGAPLTQTHGFVFELWPGTLGASARASLGLLGSVDMSRRSQHRRCFGMLPACGSGHCGAELVVPNPF